MKKLQVRINPMALTSISAFRNISGRFSNYKKDVYFFRYLGVDCKKRYMKEVIELSFEFFIELELKKIINNDLIEKYSKDYEEWNLFFTFESNELINLKIPFKFQDEFLEYTLKKVYSKIIKIYFEIKNQNKTITKNFAIKLLYWIDVYFPEIFKDMSEIKKFPKVFYMGKMGLQEYLFLYMLVLLGCDVIHLDPENKKIDIPQNLLKLSNFYEEKNSKKLNIEELSKINFFKTKSEVVDKNLVANLNKVSKIPFKEIERNERKEVKIEKFDKIASSVVMISVFNQYKECIKIGSGVFINNEGVILTNYHVILNGYYFGVQIENDNNIYYSNEVIKYHALNDLAIIKIKINNKSIELCPNKNDVVRGQKIMAIGSPLGFFNSISDGIISGVRIIDNVEMIQFTAPISSGSSGGALLDLNGRLVGLITAGFDNGQNINLAISYKIIYTFIKNFIKK